MALPLRSAIKTDYPFLAHPPPQRKRSQPLPTSPFPKSTQTTRRSSDTFSAIAAWAAHVQPGSPASFSPHSPYRRPSLGRGRCSSVTSVYAASASFLHIAPTPTTARITTPSVRDFKADLTTVGYTSVFLQLPNTPISVLSFPAKFSSPSAVKNTPIPPVPSPTLKPRGFTRFRSLSVLRSRSRRSLKSVRLDSPTKMKAKAAATSAAIVKRKKAKYAMRPPPLVNELALMQFADGGCMDDNIKRVMEAQAKATGAFGLADVYRDGDGGIWLDQDEEWEYAHLLAEREESRVAGDLQWVTFGSNTSLSVACIPSDERRCSVSTQDSDLDPKYIIQPDDLHDEDDLMLFGSAVIPLVTRKPGMSVLSIPSRPRRAAKHLRKPDFLVDVGFSRPHGSPRSSKFPISPGTSFGTVKTKGKARRRPAPLKLSPPSPAFKRPTNSPIDPDKVRQDFIEASFDPMSVSVPMTPFTPATIVSVPTPMNALPQLAVTNRAINAPWRTVNDGLISLRMKTKPSMLNMMALFRSGKRKM